MDEDIPIFLPVSSTVVGFVRRAARRQISRDVSFFMRDRVERAERSKALREWIRPIDRSHVVIRWLD